MGALVQMFQKKINILNLVTICAFASMNALANDFFEGQSGEIISIPAADEVQPNTLTFQTSSGMKQLVSLPFVKQDQIISRHHVNVKVNWVDFGESRITITDQSKVTLSATDQARANKEGLEIKQALSKTTKAITPSFNFIPPVPGIITSPFGKQRFINGLPRSAHLALDFRGSVGTPIVSPLKGEVVLVGDYFYTGLTLILDHGYGLFSSYAHMSGIKVNLGDLVEQSNEIGLVGSTGRVTGPHLHWTVYFDGNKINPESLIQANYLNSIL
jgi:murein DD-endopeptidase MepM/ murein hydrolase activator NlpD